MTRGRYLNPDSIPEVAPNVPMWVCNCGNGPLADDEPYCSECADKGAEA